MALAAPAVQAPRSSGRIVDLDVAQSLKLELEEAFSAAVSPIAVLETFTERQPRDRFAQSLRDVPLHRLDRVLATQAPDILQQAMRGRPLTIPVSRIAAQSGRTLTPRMSVGYRLADNDAFALEVRLQHPDVQSVLYAKSLVKERVGDHVPIGILNKVVAQGGINPAALNNDPLTVGSSVGHLNGGPGTLGLFVTMGKTPGFLSCSHVLSNAGNAKFDDPIYHPAPGDSMDHEAIGLLRQFIDLSGDGPFTMDAAFAALNPDKKTGGNRIPKGQRWPSEGRDLGEPVMQAVPVSRATVAKIGRSTGRTTGTISLENVGPIDIYVSELSRNVTVQGMTEVRWRDVKQPFSDFGDSGSLVYLEDSLQPVGIVVAGGIAEIEKVKVGVSYVCPLAPIMKCWDLTLS